MGRKVLHPLNLVDAAPWRETVFTTYSLSLSFFEAVVLDRLVRGGGRNALILSDPEGVRAGLSEQGARRIGRDYELEPISCSTGVFHAKVNAFFHETDCHLLVGSGNLTFGGWGMNMEVFEHLHPSFAADAITDAAGFFDGLSISDNVRHGVPDRLEAIGANLRLAARGGTTTGKIRFLHNLELPIADQLAAMANDLGGANRIVVISPFYDRLGLGLRYLSEQLACDDIHMHVHRAGSVRGLNGMNWPSNAIGKPVQVSGEYSDDGRLLHAKCFEIRCAKGRLIVSGSANATRAALANGNVESAVVRIQPDASVYWTVTPCTPPAILGQDKEEGDEDEKRVGILRASLEEGRVVGLVLTGRIAGQMAQATISSVSGDQTLGEVMVNADGTFDLPAPEIEAESWSSGRLILRLSAGEELIEGFITLAAARDIIRRAGSMAPRIMALLGAMETPADVAALLSWFAESPDRLLSTITPNQGNDADQKVHAPVWVSETDLIPNAANFQGHDPSYPGAPVAGWSRALDMVLAAFAQPRGAWKQGTEADDNGRDETEKETPDELQRRLEELERLKRKAAAAFQLLLEKMLSPEHGSKHAQMAFTVGHYLVDRNRPSADTVRPWLQRILGSFAALDPSVHAAPLTAALLLRATDTHDSRPSKARRYLLRHGVDPKLLALVPEEIPGFLEIFAPGGWDAAQYLERVKLARTPGEDIQRYLDLPAGTTNLDDCPNLSSSPFRQKLLKGLSEADVRGRFIVTDKREASCPRCNMNFNGQAKENLDEFGMTICCRVILCTEI